MIAEPIKKAGYDFVLSNENIQKLAELEKKYVDKKSLTLPALWMVQEQQGWISVESLEYLEKHLELPIIHLYETASFYVMFNFEKKGKYQIKMCKTLSCELRGQKELMAHLKKRFGIEKVGDTSQDGLFTLEETECLGYCNDAPIMLCNLKQHDTLDLEKLDAIIDQILKEEA